MGTQATLTPQNTDLTFPLVGSLENHDTISQIGLAMLNHAECGLFAIAKDDNWIALDNNSDGPRLNESLLCRHLKKRLEGHPETSREEWARLKEFALLLHGGPLASCIDYLASAMRTPAISESAIRSAGMAFYDANSQKSEVHEQKARAFFRKLMLQVIEPMSAEELAV